MYPNVQVIYTYSLVSATVNRTAPRLRITHLGLTSSNVRSRSTNTLSLRKIIAIEVSNEARATQKVWLVQ